MRTECWESFAQDAPPRFASTAFLPATVADPKGLNGLVGAALETAKAKAPGELRLRAFRPGVIDYPLTQAFLASPLMPGEAPQDWLARVADDADVCIAVNEVSAWSPELSAWAERRLRALLRPGELELPSSSDVYIFVAAAGWTPFGIHDDAGPSFIFHLGPADKEVWVWPDGPPDHAAGDRRRMIFDIEPHLESAEHYVMRPGDFLCIPAGAYHVFRNLGPSTLLGLTLHPTDSRARITDAIWQATTTVRGRASVDDGPATGEAVIGLARSMLAEVEGTAPLAQRVTNELTVDQLLRRTNGYLPSLHRAVLPYGPPADDVSLRWAHPGVVGAVIVDGATVLGVRGRVVEFRRPFDFTSLVVLTESSAEFTLAELTDALPPDLAPARRRQLAEILFRFGAVTVA